MLPPPRVLTSSSMLPLQLTPPLHESLMMQMEKMTNYKMISLSCKTLPFFVIPTLHYLHLNAPLTLIARTSPPNHLSFNISSHWMKLSQAMMKLSNTPSRMHMVLEIHAPSRTEAIHHFDIKEPSLVLIRRRYNGESHVPLTVSLLRGMWGDYSYSCSTAWFGK